jgi:hypothetical protein
MIKEHRVDSPAARPPTTKIIKIRSQPPTSILLFLPPTPSIPRALEAATTTPSHLPKSIDCSALLKLILLID